MTLLTLNQLARGPSSSRSAGTLSIGLVNNMPDAALRTTEWQVRDLLTRAAGDHVISLRVFSLPEIPRSEIGRQHVTQFHEPIEALWQGEFAGLIVTGTEPKAHELEHEPYWSALSRLIDWAEYHTVSTIWSCLASHAAAWRLDRIRRQPLGQKMFGVFECDRVTEHKLVNGLERRLVPHSRHNALPEEALRDAGYLILSRSVTAGVDLFIKERNNLFVFLQGHPEYDATALFGEYRRDVRRFIARDIDRYPELPFGYFTENATTALLKFRDRVMTRRKHALLEEFPAQVISFDLMAPWQNDASQLYANWLDYCASKASGAPS